MIYFLKGIDKMYNKIKDTLKTIGMKKQGKINKHNSINNQAVFKNTDDYFLLDYSNNYSNYDY